MMPLAAIDWHAFFFLLFALLACGFGLAVVASSNIVRMAFYLTLSLGATAGLFFLAGAQFVGAMQFMIYVGGTLVLLIFGVMLTAKSDFINMKTAAGEWIAGGALGAALLVLLMRGGLSVENWRTSRAEQLEQSVKEGKLDRAEAEKPLTIADVEDTAAIGLILTGVRVDKLPNQLTGNPPHPLPNSLSGYLFPFVIISMHLLVVLVGASYLARTKRRGTGPAPVRGSALAAAPRSLPRHDFLVTGGIMSGIVVNVVLAILCLTFSQWTSSLGSGDSPTAKAIADFAGKTPSWLPLALAGLFAFNVLALSVTWQWQRWGVVALMLVPFVIFGLVMSTPLGLPVAVVLLALTIAPAAALLGLLLTGRPSAWSRME
jgi:NADH:ubiquinone oxidoreductase subunit 6 (subunit J)